MGDVCVYQVAEWALEVVSGEGWHLSLAPHCQGGHVIGGLHRKTFEDIQEGGVGQTRSEAVCRAFVKVFGKGEG